MFTHNKLIRALLIALVLAVPSYGVEVFTCPDGHRATRNPFNNTMTDAEICDPSTKVKTGINAPSSEFEQIFGSKPAASKPGPNGKRVRTVVEGLEYETRTDYRLAMSTYRREFARFAGILEISQADELVVLKDGEVTSVDSIVNLEPDLRLNENRIKEIAEATDQKYGLGKPVFFLRSDVPIRNATGTGTGRATALFVTFPDVPGADTSETQKGISAKLLLSHPGLFIANAQLRAIRACHEFFPDQMHPFIGPGATRGTAHCKQ